MGFAAYDIALAATELAVDSARPLAMDVTVPDPRMVMFMLLMPTAVVVAVAVAVPLTELATTVLSRLATAEISPAVVILPVPPSVSAMP